MLMLEELLKVGKQIAAEAPRPKYYFFVSKWMGEYFGLRDGQLISNGAVQIVLSK